MLDFQRFPIYFPQDEGPEHVKTMTSWVREIGAMTYEIGEERGRPLLLSARVLACPIQNLAIGLDPITWAKEDLVDFIVASHFLRNDFPLPIKEYRDLLPERTALYASIQEKKNADSYGRIACTIYEDGVDGFRMFNYFTCRSARVEPDFFALRGTRRPGSP